MPLTDPAIRNAKPRERPYKLGDAGGLFLLVTPAGGKWWRLKYRFGGEGKAAIARRLPLSVVMASIKAGLRKLLQDRRKNTSWSPERRVTRATGDLKALEASATI